jgi:anti-anti-sigma factor
MESSQVRSRSAANLGESQTDRRLSGKIDKRAQGQSDTAPRLSDALDRAGALRMDYQVAPVNVATSGDSVRVTFNGPIHTNTAWIERELDAIVKSKPKTVELDLLKTEHISSLGLGVLVSFYNRLHADGAKVVVVAIRKHTVRILHLAYLDKLLTIPPEAIVG